MQVHLVNPSDVSFGIGVITPRWLYVLAGATPARYGDPEIVDETLEPIQPDTIRPGDIVGIGGFGSLILSGFRNNFYRAQIMTATLATVLLALIFDALLILITYWVTPWARGRRGVL